MSRGMPFCFPLLLQAASLDHEKGLPDKSPEMISRRIMLLLLSSMFNHPLPGELKFLRPAKIPTSFLPIFFRLTSRCHTPSEPVCVKNMCQSRRLLSVFQCLGNIFYHVLHCCSCRLSEILRPKRSILLLLVGCYNASGRVDDCPKAVFIKEMNQILSFSALCPVSRHQNISCLLYTSCYQRNGSRGSAGIRQCP